MAGVYSAIARTRKSSPLSTAKPDGVQRCRQLSLGFRDGFDRTHPLEMDGVDIGDDADLLAGQSAPAAQPRPSRRRRPFPAPPSRHPARFPGWRAASRSRCSCCQDCGRSCGSHSRTAAIVSLVLVLPERAGDANDADIEPASGALPPVVAVPSTGSGTAISGSGEIGWRGSPVRPNQRRGCATRDAASATKRCPSCTSPFTAMKRSPGTISREFRSIQRNSVCGSSSPMTWAPVAFSSSVSGIGGEVRSSEITGIQQVLNSLSRRVVRPRA